MAGLGEKLQDQINIFFCTPVLYDAYHTQVIGNTRFVGVINPAKYYLTAGKEFLFVFDQKI